MTRIQNTIAAGFLLVCLATLPACPKKSGGTKEEVRKPAAARSELTGDSSATEKPAEPAPEKPAAAAEEKKESGDESMAEKPVGNPTISLKTSLGEIKLKLNGEKAPKSVANFLGYVESKHYDGTVFHRVIDNFMIQGGGYTASLQKKPTRDPVQNEADNGLKNTKGTIALARTMDPHSATAQFFINVKDNDFLNHTDKSTRGWGYTVFGEVISGMDVVEKIEAVKTGRKGPFPKDVPLEDVVIESVTVVE